MDHRLPGRQRFSRAGQTGFVIEPATRDEIVPLRHAVLRTGYPVETALYPEDDRPETFHLVDREPDGDIIACVTFFPELLGEKPAWRFRGMATQPEQRNRGVGGRLLEAGITAVAERGGTVVWCNGRSSAGGFYRRHGFHTVGDEFLSGPGHDIPHFVFVRALA